MRLTARDRRWLGALREGRLVAIIAAGAAVRIAWCAYAVRQPAGLHDPGLYRLLAEHLASGEGYRLLDGEPTAYYPAGYPMALAVAFLLTPVSWQMGAAAALNIAAQLAAVVLVFAITRTLVSGRNGPALIAAAAVALWPNLVLNTAAALSESLFVAVVLAAVLVMIGGPWEGAATGWRRLVATGALLGLATFVRPVAPPLVLALVLGWLLAGTGWRRAVAQGVVVGTVAVVVLVPWMVRNAVVMDAFVLSTNTGDNLCMSRRVGGSGGFEFPNVRCNNGPFDRLERPAYETERDAHGRRLAWEFVRDHPAEEVGQWWRRAVATFESDDDALEAVESYGDDPFLGRGLRSGLRAVSNGWYAVAGILGVAGLAVVARRRTPAGLVVAASAVALALAPILTFGDPRFKVPVLPLLAVGVGVLADAAISRWAGS